MIKSQTFRHPVLGIVKVETRVNARSFRASWQRDHLRLYGPSNASAAEFMKVLDDFTPKLLATRPTVQSGPDYRDGFKYVQDDWSISIVLNETTSPTGPVTAYRVKPPSEAAFAYEIRLHPSTDFSDPYIREGISSVIKKVAGGVAKSVLIDQAKKEAAALGLAGKVSGWSIGRGLRTFGTCDARGHIALSSTLMFWPRELRRSTITHELAHLTHLDHSPAFKALWDKYLGHSHLIDRQRIRAISLPILK